MTRDDHDTTPRSTVKASTDTSSPDATVNAFAAALMVGIGKLGGWRDRFQKAADEAAGRDSLLAYLRYMALANEEQEDAIRKRYPRAVLDWNQLEKRARALGIAFSVTAQAHRRAAVLDYLDNPGAPTLITHKHLTWFAPITTRDLERNAENWRRYQKLCTPLRDRAIGGDCAVRARLTGLRCRSALHAAGTVVSPPRTPL